MTPGCGDRTAARLGVTLQGGLSGARRWRLARRGLRGVKLVIADAQKGLKTAVTKMLRATWQRCRWLSQPRPEFYHHPGRYFLETGAGRARSVSAHGRRAPFRRCLSRLPAVLDDMLRGAADTMVDPAPSSIPHPPAGRLAPIAATGRPELRRCPSCRPSLRRYRARPAAPRDISAESVARLKVAVNEGRRDAGIQRDLDALGGEAMPTSTTQFGRFIAGETTRYAEIIRRAGIRQR